MPKIEPLKEPGYDKKESIPGVITVYCLSEFLIKPLPTNFFCSYGLTKVLS